MCIPLSIAATTDIGRKRKNNEDSLGCFLPNGDIRAGGSERLTLNRGDGARKDEVHEASRPLVSQPGSSGTAPEVLAVVCDGMGGVEGGEVASALGVESLGRWYRNFCCKALSGAVKGVEPSTGASGKAVHLANTQASSVLPCAGVPAKDIPEESCSAPTEEVRLSPNVASLNSAVLDADRAIWDAAASDPERRGMGATLSALWIAKGRYVIAQVGDSRVYRWRDGELTQLTEDQTVLNRLAKEGKIPANPMIAARFRSTLEQALGSEPGLLKPVTQTGDVAEGDLYILCSDGLYDGLDNNALSSYLKRYAGRMSIADLSARIVRESVERAGRDNTTAIIVAVGEICPVKGFLSRFL